MHFPSSNKPSSHAAPHTDLPNHDFLKAPDVPPELRALYLEKRPLRESEFSGVVNWLHRNNFIPVVRDMLRQGSSTGVLHVQASEPQPPGIASPVGPMLVALREHGVPCTELHVQLCNTDDANQLLAYLDGVGRHGLRALSIDLSAFASDQVVPQELGRCILSMQMLRQFSLRVSGNDTHRVTLQSGFFAEAPNNHSIEWLEIVGPIDGELSGDLVRGWLANKGLHCIVLGRCDLAATFCREIVRLPKVHAVENLQLVDSFKGSDKLALKIARAETGVLHLTLPPCSEGEDLDKWLHKIAYAVMEQNFELQSLAMTQAHGTPLPLDRDTGYTAFAPSLERNRRIRMAVHTEVAPHVAKKMEMERPIQALRNYIDETFDSGTLTLDGLVTFVSDAWGLLPLTEDTLQIVLTEVRWQLEMAFDAALDPDNEPFEPQVNWDVLPPGRYGRRGLSPVEETPPLPDLMRDDPWSTLVPSMEAILTLKGVPEPVTAFLSRGIKPELKDFSKVVFWCLTAKQQIPDLPDRRRIPNLLDVLVSMQIASPDFAGELDFTEDCPAEISRDPITTLMELRDAGIQITGFSVEVNSAPVMDQLIEFLESPGMLSTSVEIDIGQQVRVPSRLGLALFRNPRLSAVNLFFPSVAARNPPWRPSPDFFDALAHNTTLKSLLVYGEIGTTEMNCDFEAWIRRGVVENIFLNADVLGAQVAQALVSSAGESRVRAFYLMGTNEFSLTGPIIAALLNQRLGLTSLQLPAPTLEKSLNDLELGLRISETLMQNHSLTQFTILGPDGDSEADDALHLIKEVLERNVKLQLAGAKAGINAALKYLSTNMKKEATDSDRTAFSQAMAPYVIALSNAGKLNLASMTHLSSHSASRTRAAFETERSNDRTGSKIFGNYFQTWFEPTRPPRDLLEELRMVGAKLTDPEDYQALKQQVLGVMMAWLENTLRSGHPKKEQEQEEDAAPTVIDLTPDAPVN